MQHLSIRFLIGLAQAQDGPRGTTATAYDARAATALSILSREYPGLSSWRGVGYWQGESEPVLVVETVQPIGEDVEETNSGFLTEGRTVGRAQTIAGELARALEQNSVALVIQPVRFSLEGPHATEG